MVGPLHEKEKKPFTHLINLSEIQHFISYPPAKPNPEQGHEGHLSRIHAKKKGIELESKKEN